MNDFPQHSQVLSTDPFAFLHDIEQNFDRSSGLALTMYPFPRSERRSMKPGPREFCIQGSNSESFQRLPLQQTAQNTVCKP